MATPVSKSFLLRIGFESFGAREIWGGLIFNRPHVEDNLVVLFSLFFQDFEGVIILGGWDTFWILFGGKPEFNDS